MLPEVTSRIDDQQSGHFRALPRPEGNLAMAAYAYRELVRRGAKLSNTLVLNDNWPSRRTAEKLGAFVCANYIVYRRNVRH
jgi:hypothetical protein